MSTTLTEKFNLKKNTKRSKPYLFHGSTSRFVRQNLTEILNARDELSWPEIAQTLTEQGITWKNGNPLSGSSLRSLVHRIQTTERLKSIDSLPHPMIKNVPKPISTPKVNIPQSPPKKTTYLREEMQRAAKERQK